VLGGSLWMFHRWAPVKVKLLLPPRHSRGISRDGLMVIFHGTLWQD
jgi:hypothetical protein